MLPVDALVEDLERALRGEFDYDPLSGLNPISWDDDPVERITDSEGLPETPGVLPQTTTFGVKPLDRMSNTRDEQRIADETFEQSPNFQSAQAATMPQKVSPERWMQKYENGRVPDFALAEVPGLGRYRPDAARAMRAMKRAAKKDGVNLSGGGYRSYEEQEALQWKEDQLGIPVAEPGHSNHGWGLAADLSTADPRVFEWLQNNAKRFGWVNPEWAQNGVEPWHWEYQGGFKGGRPKRKPKDNVRLRRVQRPEQVEPELVSAADPLVSMPMAFASVIGETRGPAVKTRQAFDEHQKTGGLGFVPQKYRRWFQAAAEKYNLSPRLLGIVAEVESSFNPDAVSSAGAQGLMQVMPLHGMDDPFNPKANIFKGAEILASYMSGLGLRKGLAAYNAGPSNYQAGLAYADEILRRLKGG